MKLELCFERENIPEEFIKDLKGKENFMSAKIKLVNEFGDEQDLSFYLKLSLVYSDSITPVNSEVQVQNQDALRVVNGVSGDIQFRINESSYNHQRKTFSVKFEANHMSNITPIFTQPIYVYSKKPKKRTRDTTPQQKSVRPCLDTSSPNVSCSFPPQEDYNFKNIVGGNIDFHYGGFSPLASLSLLSNFSCENTQDHIKADPDLTITLVGRQFLVKQPKMYNIALLAQKFIEELVDQGAITELTQGYPLN